MTLLLVCDGFQSHLYGIERKLFYLCLTDFNSFNRTFMELKGTQFAVVNRQEQFQSHLYGIESTQLTRHRHRTRMFQSHLYGIESSSRKSLQKSLESFNRTFMELKVEYFI